MFSLAMIVIVALHFFRQRPFVRKFASTRQYHHQCIGISIFLHHDMVMWITWRVLKYLKDLKQNVKLTWRDTKWRCFHHLVSDQVYLVSLTVGHACRRKRTSNTIELFCRYPYTLYKQTTCRSIYADQINRIFNYLRHIVD